LLRDSVQLLKFVTFSHGDSLGRQFFQHHGKAAADVVV